MRKNPSDKTESKRQAGVIIHDASVENKESVSPVQNSQISYRANSTGDMEIGDGFQDLKRVDRTDANNHNRR